MLSQNKLAPKRCCQKFSKLNFKKIARRHFLKSQKYWSYKVLLDIIIATTIIQMNSLFVLYILLIHLLWTFDEVSDEMDPIHQELSKVYTMRTNDEAICLTVFFSYVLPRHTNIMTNNLWWMCFQLCTSVPTGRTGHRFFLSGQ